MAIQKQVTTLRQGTDGWNSWRQKHPDEKIDLSDANLSGANLSGANLSGADLNGADLSLADLSNADLSKARLFGAHLNRATLSGADLTEATLIGATLIRTHLNNINLNSAILHNANIGHADLSNANLIRATLVGADLSSAILGGADFSNALVGQTIFGNVNLRTVKGLETVQHQAPSTIGTDTLERSEGDIPEIFLRGAGVSDILITYARSLFQSPSEYYTCFLSYSSKDQDFAERLYADLQNKGVRCWFAPHSMRPGTVIVRGIDEAIRLYDKLLLVLSEHSVESTWVAFEVAAALEKEKEQRKETLFPIRLDNAALTTQQAWAAGIRRQRHIGDFTRWKDHDAYQHVFDRLLNDLQTSAIKKSH